MAKLKKLVFYLLLLSALVIFNSLLTQAQSANYSTNPFVINLPSSLTQDISGVGLGNGAGGVFAHDLNRDGLMDFVITNIGVVAAYDHFGTQLWLINDDIWLSTYGAPGLRSSYPGYHNPGVIAGDIDGDGQQELVYLTFSGLLKVRNAQTGIFKKSYPSGNAVAVAIANFRGAGDRDAVLLYSETEIRAINLETGSILWRNTNWRELDDTATRVADIDGDGKDEVLGPYILDSSGNRLNSWDLERDLGTELTGLDSLAVGDVVSGGPLELVFAEQGANNEVIAVNQNRILWHTFRDDVPGTGECSRIPDPDKVTVGNFDPSRSGLEIFARSSCARHPWVLDSSGNIIAKWDVSQTAPQGWYLGNNGNGGPLPNGVPTPEDEGGIDDVQAINWFGDSSHTLALMQRQEPGPAALVNPMNGTFIRVFPGKTVRVYAADVVGDFRDELITLNLAPSALKIYWNSQPSASSQPDPWLNRLYRRLKQNFSHYSTPGISSGTSSIDPNPSSCINTAPDPSTVPNMESVINQVATEHPNWLLSVCEDFNFIDEVVRRLRAGTGGIKWAYEAKRANLNDPWKEGISYYYGSGTSPQPGTMANYEVFAIDVVHQDCANPSVNTPYWSVADWPNNPNNPGQVLVAYLYPRTAGGSLPTPQLCSNQPSIPPTTPQPTTPIPTPTGPPTITGISPQTAVAGQIVEIHGANLVESIQLEDVSTGTSSTVTASINSDQTTASFEVPNITGGNYKITVSGSQGSATSPQNLTIRSGGPPFGQPTQPTIPTQGLPGFGQLIATIFTWSLSVLGIVVFVMIFYAGFMWFTAAGNTARVNEARAQITNAITGAIILLAAYIILYTINPDLVGGIINLPGIGN